MTDIEQKALALLREVEDERGTTSSPGINRASNNHEALCRAIEQHEAFRQEVSDAVNDMVQRTGSNHGLYRFMLPKPDPLVEAWNDMFLGTRGDCGNCIDAEMFRAAIEKRGGKIVWGEG